MTPNSQWAHIFTYKIQQQSLACYIINESIDNCKITAAIFNMQVLVARKPLELMELSDEVFVDVEVYFAAEPDGDSA